MPKFKKIDVTDVIHDIPILILLGPLFDVMLKLVDR